MRRPKVAPAYSCCLVNQNQKHLCGINNNMYLKWGLDIKGNSYLCTVFTATQNDLPHSFLPPTSTGSSALPLSPVAVVTLLLYTMAGWLHNVFLLVQFVAHTTAEWAWNTPNHPPTLRSMLMKSLPSPGSFHTKSYRTAESFRVRGFCPAAKATSF